MEKTKRKNSQSVTFGGKKLEKTKRKKFQISFWLEKKLEKSGREKKAAVPTASNYMWFSQSIKEIVTDLSRFCGGKKKNFF